MHKILSITYGKSILKMGFNLLYKYFEHVEINGEVRQDVGTIVIMKTYILIECIMYFKSKCQSFNHIIYTWLSFCMLMNTKENCIVATWETCIGKCLRKESDRIRYIVAP